MIRMPGLMLLIAIMAELSLLHSCTSADTSTKTIMVPMRDGIRLATDFHFPEGGAGKFPVILIRTPYKKEMFKFYSDYFTHNGYIVAVQDVRGCFSSEGEWEPFVNEGEDGYDTVEWIAAQEWCAGKIGMTGGSYDGWSAYCAAAEKPPHLTTIIPCCTPSDVFQDVPYSFGALAVGGLLFWIKVIETEATTDPTGQKMKEAYNFDPENRISDLPVIDLDRKIFGKEIPYWRKWMQHNSYDSYWEKANVLRKLKGHPIPIFLQTGWFDENKIGAKIAFLELRDNNRNMKMTAGPWGHMDWSSKELLPAYLKWFDYWLREKENGILKEPLVQLFVIGSNQWLQADSYPLSKTQFTKFYLATTEKKGSSEHGMLQRQIPSAAKEYESYQYDPSDPPPLYLMYEAVNQLGSYVEARKSRKDILVYETEPFKNTVTIAGPISAKLYASSSSKDTDWCAVLYVLGQNNNIIYSLGFGMLRARFKTSLSKPEYLEKNKIYEFTIDLRHNAYTIPENCRLCMEISSSFFPFYSRNLNTGGHNEMDTEYSVAENRIYQTREYPSHLILPVVDLSDFK